MSKFIPSLANKTFRERPSMQKEKPCVIPEEGFRKDSGLPNYYKRGGSSPVTPFRCAKCGKSLSRKDHLVRHQRIHVADKPHKCSYCGKTFFERSDLMRHERIHTGEKPYKCSSCEKSFSRKWLLMKHKKTHTG